MSQHTLNSEFSFSKPGCLIEVKKPRLSPDLSQYFLYRPIGIIVTVFTNGPGDQVESYRRFKKWYLMPPCLTLSILRCESRVKWGNTGKGVALSPTCSSSRKGKPLRHPRLRSPTFFTYYFIYCLSSYNYNAYIP